MLRAPVFIFTSGSSALLEHPARLSDCCYLPYSIHISEFMSGLLFHKKTDKTRTYLKSAFFVWYENVRQCINVWLMWICCMNAVKSVLADVWTVSPSSEQRALCSDEGLTLETSANTLFTAFSISTLTLCWYIAQFNAMLTQTKTSSHRDQYSIDTKKWPPAVIRRAKH